MIVLLSDTKPQGLLLFYIYSNKIIANELPSGCYGNLSKNFNAHISKQGVSYKLTYFLSHSVNFLNIWIIFVFKMTVEVYSIRKCIHVIVE